MLAGLFFILWVLVLSLAGYLTVGYPLVTFLLAAFRPGISVEIEIQPTVSIIIPCFNEAAVIAEKVQATLDLDYPSEKIQIIVADDGSQDKTVEIANHFRSQGVEVISYPERKGKVSVMNESVREAHGEIVAFTDADVFCPPDSLTHLMRHFADETVGCVTAGHRIKADGSQAGKANDLYWKYESILKTLESRIFTTVAASGHMLAVRRSLIEPIPPGIIVDDFYRALTILRQGYRVIYEAAAVCIQRPVTSMVDELIRRKRINAGRFQVIRAMREFLPAISPLARFQVLSHKLGRPFLPFLMLLALLLNPLPLLLPDRQALPSALLIFTTMMLAIQIVFYALAFCGYLFDKVGLKSRLVSLPYYLVSANIGALLGFFTYLSGRQSVLWDQAERT